ncbi:MAG: YraN family protein [Xanthomonadaceae bacterium]|nr:YraN family protein [Rhodospirillaceae bacterium]NIA17710.1 YraN family protein [Xanthomonadaceae bacterium]
MLNKNQRFGNWGERIVRKYLVRNGYKILETNYKNYFGEIDIIAKLKSKIIFIEVKTRSNRRFGLPEESVNFIKQKKLIKASEKYILVNRLNNEYQIDVITVEKEEGADSAKLKHFKNAVKYF